MHADMLRLLARASSASMMATRPRWRETGQAVVLCVAGFFASYSLEFRAFARLEQQALEDAKAR